jgi:hypothetical protein
VEVSAAQVDWNVLEPIAIATRITADGVAQSVEGGPYEPLGPQGQDSFVSGAGLFDLLVGDFESVQTHYEVERLAPDADGGWRLRLTPLAAGLASVVAEIGVGGCAAIETVEVRQTGGDVMEIALTRSPESGG